MSKLYRNWWVHNGIIHPLMQLIGWFNRDLANYVHDITMPERVKPSRDKVLDALLMDYRRVAVADEDADVCAKCDLEAFCTETLFEDDNIRDLCVSMDDETKMLGFFVSKPERR